LCSNSLDAVSDRDFAIEFAAAAALIMVHLSRFAEELVLWSSPRFGFVIIADRFCTGSSIMPQKKNPDAAELVRGKTARVIGHLTALLVLMKAQPLAYNKDNQEDKEPLFDTVDTLELTLSVAREMLRTLRFDRERLAAAAADEFLAATDLADLLVRRGVPFRESHGIVGDLVRRALERGGSLSDLSDADVAELAPELDGALRDVLTEGAWLESKVSEGGTSLERVREQLGRARAALSEAEG
jgi:argininosuccinate lyase